MDVNHRVARSPFSISRQNPRAQSSLLMAHPAARAVAVAASTTGGANVPRISQFLFGFIIGGIVFSSIFAAVGAFLAVGAENAKRILDVRKAAVKYVWDMFRVGLGLTKAALRRDGNWNLRGAWKVFWEGFRETRRAAAEGAEAVRLESEINAAFVGKPGLIALQYSVDHLTPKLLAATLEEALRDTLATVKDKNINKVELAEFSVGKKTPQMMDARAYELGDVAMAFDIDVKWESEIETTMMVTTSRINMNVPITLSNINFEGVVRVVLSPLIPEPPGFGAAMVSILASPTVGMDVRMAGGEITRMPWLRTEIMSTIQEGIESEFLWPRRMVIPTQKPTNQSDGKNVLSKSELEELMHEDPLLRAERELSISLENLTATPSIDSLEEPLVMVSLENENCISDGDDEYCVVDLKYQKSSEESNLPTNSNWFETIRGLPKKVDWNFMKAGNNSESTEHHYSATNSSWLEGIRNLPKKIDWHSFKVSNSSESSEDHNLQTNSTWIEGIQSVPWNSFKASNSSQSNKDHDLETKASWIEDIRNLTKKVGWKKSKASTSDKASEIQDLQTDTSI